MLELGRIVGIAVSVCMSFAGSAQAIESCWQPVEVQAAQFRNLQSLMMVGSLKCSGQNDVSGYYNQFVTKNRSILIGHNRLLKARFMREHGVRNSQQAYDSFTTALANRHSALADASADSFCQMVATVVQIASTAQPSDLALLATHLSEESADITKICEAPPANTAPLEIQASPAGAVQEATAQTASLDPAAPVGSSDTQAQSPAAALHAAAMAVQAAAAALQAQSSTPETSQAQSDQPNAPARVTPVALKSEP